jgi:hypothetical protein
VLLGERAHFKHSRVCGFTAEAITLPRLSGRLFVAKALARRWRARQ